MVKIGFSDFWGYKNNPVNWYEIDDYFLKAFRIYGIDYKIIDPTENEADIVIKSVFTKNEKLKGNPVIIGYSGEPFYNVEGAKYGLNFEDDSDTNLYYPLWQINSSLIYDNPIEKNADKKDLFCSFICSVNTPKREEVYVHVSSNYKPIIASGRIFTTSGYFLPPFYGNFKFAQKLHERVKFNMCFENKETHGTTSYISEKIINAYALGTVPIYCGAENVTRWFNPDSFINCNGLTKEEILDKIIEVDSNDNLYRDMLYANPFKENINWKEYTYARLISFLKSKNLV